MDKKIDRLDLISDIPVLDTDGKEIVLESYDIELNDVTFAYDTRQVLDGISLKIPQNSTCAIVGPSGSGKTTLCNIINWKSTQTGADRIFYRK